MTDQWTNKFSPREARRYRVETLKEIESFALELNIQVQTLHPIITVLENIESGDILGTIPTQLAGGMATTLQNFSDCVADYAEGIEASLIYIRKKEEERKLHQKEKLPSLSDGAFVIRKLEPSNEK